MVEGVRQETNTTDFINSLIELGPLRLSPIPFTKSFFRFAAEKLTDPEDVQTENQVLLEVQAKDPAQEHH